MFINQAGKFSGSKEEVTKKILSNYPDDSNKMTGSREEVTKAFLSRYPDDSNKMTGSREEVTKAFLSRYPDEEVKVKHLIAYLQQLDPEMSVQLDKDGWQHESNPMDTIQNSGLFDASDDTLFINN